MINLAATTVDITPREPVPLGGNGRTTTVFTRIDKPVEANLLMLSDGNVTIIIVSIDALFVGATVLEYLRGYLKRRRPDYELAVFATHTHSAPALDCNKPNLGLPSKAHLQFVCQEMTNALESLLDTPPHTGKIGTSIQPARIAVIRRLRHRILLGRNGLRFNRWAPGVDETRRPATPATVVEFKSLDSPHPIAVLWSVACHPVGFPDANTLSPHFPGVIRDALREHYNSPELPVLFLQGFSGDLRPDTPSTNRPSRAGFRRLFRARGYSNFDETDYQMWCLRLAETVLSAVQDLETSSLQDSSLAVQWNTVPGFVRSSGVEGTHALEAVRIDIGRVTVLGVSAEPVHELQGDLGDKARVAIFAGCLNDTVCYLPTSRMVGQGGYEVDGFLSYFGIEALPEYPDAVFGRMLARMKGSKGSVD